MPPKSPYKLVKRIIRKGWPTTSKKWKKAHRQANKAELKRFGKQAFKAVQRVVTRMPANELLGSHTKKGKVRISKRVPARYREQVAFHERVEHRIMTRRKKHGSGK